MQICHLGIFQRLQKKKTFYESPPSSLKSVFHDREIAFMKKNFAHGFSLKK